MSKELNLISMLFWSHVLWFINPNISIICSLPVVQRFVPTHRRNTSDYSSDSSSTGNSPETQHNVSGTFPVQCSLVCWYLLLCISSRLKKWVSYPLSNVTSSHIWMVFCVSLPSLLGLEPGETPIIWPRGGCAIMWVVSLTQLTWAWSIDSSVYLWWAKGVIFRSLKEHLLHVNRHVSFPASKYVHLNHPIFNVCVMYFHCWDTSYNQTISLIDPLYIFTLSAMASKAFGVCSHSQVLICHALYYRFLIQLQQMTKNSSKNHRKTIIITPLKLFKPTKKSLIYCFVTIMITSVLIFFNLHFYLVTVQKYAKSPKPQWAKDSCLFFIISIKSLLNHWWANHASENIKHLVECGPGQKCLEMTFAVLYK